MCSARCEEWRTTGPPFARDQGVRPATDWGGATKCDHVWRNNEMELRESIVQTWVSQRGGVLEKLKKGLGFHCEETGQQRCVSAGKVHLWPSGSSNYTSILHRNVWLMHFCGIRLHSTIAGGGYQSEGLWISSLVCMSKHPSTRCCTLSCPCGCVCATVCTLLFFTNPSYHSSTSVVIF